jgi:hypothetical protein
VTIKQVMEIYLWWASTFKCFKHIRENMRSAAKRGIIYLKVIHSRRKVKLVCVRKALRIIERSTYLIVLLQKYSLLVLN